MLRYICGVSSSFLLGITTISWLTANDTRPEPYGWGDTFLLMGPPNIGSLSLRIRPNMPPKLFRPILPRPSARSRDDIVELRSRRARRVGVKEVGVDWAERVELVEFERRIGMPGPPGPAKPRPDAARM